MKSALKPLYERLPPSLQSMASTLYGHYLAYWRYGPETEGLVAEALERERWSRERWESWRAERLAATLHRAATTVPYYREHWARRRRAGDHASWEDLANWPILTKSELREQPHAFLVDGARIHRMAEMRTSGSTGTPIVTWRSRTMMRYWYALAEARWRRWYGVSRFDRWAIIGGQEVVNVDRDVPPYWVWNGALNQLYFSALHLRRETVADYVRALHDRRVRYMLGYCSSMHVLAQLALDYGLEVPKFEAVIGNAEPFLESQRQAISAAFGCRTYETWGMSEAVAAASECEHGRMHTWPEAGLIEVMDFLEPAPTPVGAEGRLVCTSLSNDDMPLIRYDVGDVGVLASPSDVCPCGRTLPVLASIVGRSDDVLVTPSGRKVWGIDLFYEVPVLEGQVVQRSVDEVVIRIVPANGFEPGTRDVLAQRLERQLPGVRVTTEVVESIPKGANGKFRGIVSGLGREVANDVREDRPG